MRKHHKKWNVVQSGHCTVVLLHLVAATGRQHHCTVTRNLCTKPTIVTLLQGINPYIFAYYSKLIC